MNIIILFAFTSFAFGCEYKQEDHYYNLTQLTRQEPYTVKVSADSSFFKMAYQFNFCGNHPKHCQGQSAAYEMIEVMGMLTDSCEMIGKPEEPHYSLIENGLQISYTQGSSCENNMKRSSTYKILCSSQSDSNFIMESSDKCNTVFSIKSPAGCKMQYSSQPLFIYYLSGVGIFIMILGMYFTYQQVQKNKKEKADEYQKLNTDQPEKPEKEKNGDLHAVSINRDVPQE